MHNLLPHSVKQIASLPVQVFSMCFMNFFCGFTQDNLKGATISITNVPHMCRL